MLEGCCYRFIRWGMRVGVLSKKLRHLWYLDRNQGQCPTRKEIDSWISLSREAFILVSADEVRFPSRNWVKT